MSDAARQAPVVSGHQVLSAGFAAAAASFVTARFGVTGTLLGAAITAMIITGGSAVLRAYLENVSGNVRKVPNKLRTRANRIKGYPETLPERPDLRDNFAGRMRAALDWFSHLPPLTRRSILVKGLIAALVAFVIGMSAVWATEKVINNSLSCGLWANCPQGAKPGIHLSEKDGAGTSISFGSAKETRVTPANETRNPALPQENGVQQNRSYQQGSPNYQQASPRDSGGQPGGILGADKPAAEPKKTPAQQPEAPSSASPAPGDQPSESAAPGGAKEQQPGIQAQDASPAPAE